jgi:hypothetical protein
MNEFFNHVAIQETKDKIKELKDAMVALKFPFTHIEETKDHLLKLIGTIEDLKIPFTSIQDTKIRLLELNRAIQALSVYFEVVVSIRKAIYILLGFSILSSLELAWLILRH